MAGVAKATTSTGLSNAISTYYDRVLIEALDPQLKYYQFGVKKPLPTGEGKTVVWNKDVRLGLGLLLTEGNPVELSAAYTLSTRKVSGIVQQYGGWVSFSDFVDTAAIHDVMKQAYQRIGKQAGETIERIIVGECFTDNKDTQIVGDSVCSIFKTSTELTEYWGELSTVSSTICTVSSTNVIACSDIRKAAFKLRSMNTDPYEGNDFVGIINTEQADYLVGDTTFQSWHQYFREGATTLYNGELGKVYGVRLVETTQGPALRGSNSGATASTIAYGCVIMGKGFYGVTDLDGGIKTVVSQGPDKYDPLNQVTIVGWKALFTSKVLNTSAGLILWTGAGQTCNEAYAESASSGLRRELPASY